MSVVSEGATREQQAALARNAGAARWAFNYALGRKVTAQPGVRGRPRRGARRHH
jgi:hypothetical protein